MNELEQEIQDIVSPHFTVKSIDSVNHDPHPFCIGSRHVVHASDKFSGILGTDAIERAGIYCATPGCTLPYDQHKSDKVCFLQLTGHLKTEMAQQTLLKTEDAFKHESIDGLALVETDEKYRIL